MKLKNKSKVVALMLCAVLLVGGSVMATMAYLMDTDEVVNTFTVGKVKIKLDEAKVDTDGVPVDPAERTEKGNLYHLIPGMSYTKDPTITVLDTSEDAYVRMLVTLTDAADLISVFGEEFKVEEYVTGLDTENWIYQGKKLDTAANTISYEFRHKGTDAEGKGIVMEPGALTPLFTGFTAPGTLNGDDLEKIKEFTIAVEGHAIQAAGFDTADLAWAAFDTQYEAEKQAAANTGASGQ